MRVQRREATDILTRDGETAVLIDGTVLRLSELGARVFALTEHMVEVGRLASDLEALFGAPEGSTSLEATERVVTELIGHGLLERGS